MQEGNVTLIDDVIDLSYYMNRKLSISLPYGPTIYTDWRSTFVIICACMKLKIVDT